MMSKAATVRSLKWLVVAGLSLLLLPLAVFGGLAYFVWKKVSNPGLRYSLVAIFAVLALTTTPIWAHNLASSKTPTSSHKTTVATSKPSNTTSTATSEDESSKVHTNAPAAPAQVTSTNTCDASLWNHVYHPSRLQIIDNCKTVSGVIDVVRHEADGDFHILLKLDSQYSGLINSKNTQYEHGDLVLEPVCEQAATQADAVDYCNNYRSSVTVPAVGTHVTVVGSYVLDTDHGWNEIHPVSSISAYTATTSQSSSAQTPAPATSTSTTPSTTTSGGVIKKSSTGICHAPGDAYYDRTTNYTPYATMQDCIDSGGRPSER